MGTYTSDIQKLYVAYFNRPADALGLSYWENAANAQGASVLPQISRAFAASTEYQSTYAGMNNAQIVNQIYRNLFGRDAEASGLTYWANGLSSGNFTIANAVTTIAAGAQGTDLAAYNAKVSAATKFTAALDTTAEILAYSGTTANNAAKAWLSTINSSANEVAATTTAALNAAIVTVTTPASAPVATYSVTAGTASANEGSDVLFTVNTTNVTAGNVVSYTIGGVNASDLASGSLVGTVSIGSDGKAYIPLSLANDQTTEGAETLTVTVAGVTGSVTVNDTSTTPPPAARTITLTTNVDAVTAGDGGDDIISGVLASSNYTYNAGDNIDGGAGNDTLNILDVSGTAASVVSIDGVETINVRSLVGTATDVTELDAADWNGVTTLTNASSTAGSELQVSGLSITTNVKLIGNADISIEFSNSTTANAAATLVDGGTFTGVSDYNASAVVANATAHLNLDAAPAGRVSAITVDLAGNNLVNIEAGANVEVYTLRGSGSAVLSTDDTLTTVDASGFAGNLDITLNGASNVTVTGGGGNDTFRFGTTLSNGDTVNGGAGTDTIRGTVGALGRTLNTTAVEIATLTFTDDAGGTVDVTAGSIASINILAGSAGADANIAGVANGATIYATTASDDFDDITVGAQSGASVAIELGSAGGAGTIDALFVSGAQNVTVRQASGTANAVTLNSATFDTSVTNVTVATVGGSSNFLIDDFSGSQVTSLTVTSLGSAAITFSSGIDGTALQSVTVNAGGSDGADVTLDTIGWSASSLALTSLVLNGTAGADVTVGAVVLGNGVTAASTATIVLNAASSSIVGTDTLDVSGSGSLSLTIDLNTTQSGAANIGTLYLGRGTAGASAAISLNVTETTVATGAIASIAGVTLTSAATGAQLSFGAMVVSKSGGLLFGSAAIDATDVNEIDIGAISLTVGEDASGSFASGGVLTTGGAVGPITLVVDPNSGSGLIGAIHASSIGAITLTVGGTGEIDVGTMTAEASIGATVINASGDGDVLIGNRSASGDIGAISIDAAGTSDVVFGTMTASGIGSITVAGGSGVVTFGKIGATNVGTINATAWQTGAFNIDLEDVTNGVRINLGNKATNTVVVGAGNDTITLTVGGVTGNDLITLASANAGLDQVVNFGAGTTGGDKIRFDVSEFVSGYFGNDGSAIAATTNVAFDTADGAAVTLSASASIILFTTNYAGTTALLTDAAADVTFSTNHTRASGDLLAVWSDGSDVYISSISFNEGASATDGVNSLASASALAVTNLVVLSGITPGALSTANFAFV